MANTKSAKKAVRKMARKTELNKSRRTQLRTRIRAVEEAIESGDKESAMAALKAAQPTIARTGQLGVIHRNTASRKISRLASQIKSMDA